MVDPTREALGSAGRAAGDTRSSNDTATKSTALQLADQVRQRIGDGDWEPGHRLPSEQQLADEYGVSRATVRSALRRLAESGLLLVRQGVGTFVTSHGNGIRTGLQDLRSTSASSRSRATPARSCASCASTGRPPRTRLPRLDSTGPPRGIVLERSFLADGQVVAFEHDLINAEALPDTVDAADITGSIFDYLEPFGLVPTQAVARVHAVHDASIGWGPGRPETPLYACLEQVHYLTDGAPITWSRTWFVEDKFEFTLVRSH